MAFAGVFIIHNVGDSEQVENLTKLFLGWTLLLAASAMVFKAWLQGRRSLEARMAGGDPRDRLPPFAVIPTASSGSSAGRWWGSRRSGPDHHHHLPDALVPGSWVRARRHRPRAGHPAGRRGRAAHILVGDFQPYHGTDPDGSIPRCGSGRVCHRRRRTARSGRCWSSC
jgi:hypothetical protein